jgi:hypothetical protein
MTIYHVENFTSSFGGLVKDNLEKTWKSHRMFGSTENRSGEEFITLSS